MSSERTKARILLAAGAITLLAAPVWWVAFRDGASPGQAEAKPSGRMLEVRWLGVADKALPIDVTPLHPSAAIVAGAKGKVVFRFENRSDSPVRFQAVHHLAPGPANAHFHKYECFCFKQQELGPGEVKELPVGYRFDEQLPREVRRITVSYTLFPLDAGPHAGHDHTDGSRD